MREFAEVVEAGAHVERLAVFAAFVALHQGQVEGRTAAVAGMLLPVIIPFNAIKFGANSIILFFIYKPISKWVKKEVSRKKERALDN